MAAGFMADKLLKFHAKILVAVSYPLENAYYHNLEVLAKGYQEQAMWMADRVLGSWVQTVAKILLALNESKLHDALEMTRSLREQLPPEAFPEWALEETKILEIASNFSTKLAEHWLWANIHYWYEFPHAIGCLLNPNQEVVEMAFDHLKRLATAVNEAEKEKYQNDLMTQLLRDLGWNRQQLAREAMALVLQDNRDELRRLAKRMCYGTPSTKEVMENCFAYLHRRAQVNSSSNKFNDWTKFCYNLMSPYAKAGGSPQILPSQTDFSTLHSPQGMMARQHAHKMMFSPQLSLFPRAKAVPKPGTIFAAGFKAAGVEAQQRSSAAAAFLLSDFGNKWSHIDLCWLGAWVVGFKNLFLR